MGLILSPPTSIYCVILSWGSSYFVTLAAVHFPLYFPPAEHEVISEKQRQIVCYCKCLVLPSNHSERLLSSLLSLWNEMALHLREPPTHCLITFVSCLLLILFKLCLWWFCSSCAYMNGQITSATHLTCLLTFSSPPC